MQETFIITARLKSTRLPKKILLEVERKPLIVHMINRIKYSKKIKNIIIATSTNPQDDLLEEISKKQNIDCFRGSEEDVLGRFCGAAKMSEAKTIIRICADNPFIDSNEINRLISFYFKNDCDYACNHQDRLGSGYIDGLGAEIFSKDHLIQISNDAKEAKYREHITTFFWDNISRYNLKSVPAPKLLRHPNLRFDVDTDLDLKYLNSLIDHNEGIKPENLNVITIIDKVVMNKVNQS